MTNKVAVIGVSFRLPQAKTIQEFTDLIFNESSAITKIPECRQKLFQSLKGSQAGWVDDIDLFDAQFFAIKDSEAVAMDPQQRLLLEVSWEALESAGQANNGLSGSKTGVFVGISTNDYSQIVPVPQHLENPYSITGNSNSIAANRISYSFNLAGPSVAIDTACSSSLVAVHLACNSLQNYESDMAIAAGSNLLLNPEIFTLLSDAGMLSTDYRCKTFDKDANGYVRGEGCGVVILKRYTDAVKDNDNILAIIDGSAINQDGASNGITAPNGLAQQKVINLALDKAGLSANEINYFETHGTGTPLGDPIEVHAIAQVLHSHNKKSSTSYNKPALGSIKTQIGHLEAAAGIAGLIKAIIILQQQRIPKLAHLQKLNPAITEFELAVLDFTKDTPLSKQRSLVNHIGISSFGFGGTNAHVILSKPPSSACSHSEHGNGRYHLFVFSAHSKNSLTDRLRDIEQEIDKLTMSHDQFSAFLLKKCRHFDYRCVVVANSYTMLKEQINKWLQGIIIDAVISNKISFNHRLVWVFSGQGSLHMQVAQHLIHEFPIFKSALIECDTSLNIHVKWSLFDFLNKNTQPNKWHHEARFAQPVQVAIQISLAKLWKNLGLKPAVIVGHSLGEITAAHIAGVYSLDETMQLCVARGTAMSKAEQGAMLACQCSRRNISPFIEIFDSATVSVINSPEDTVVSGSRKQLLELEKNLKENDIHTKWLDVKAAFHSTYMNSAAEEFFEAIKSIRPKGNVIPLYSSVTGRLIDSLDLTASYWKQQMLSTVNFSGAMGAIIEKGYNQFLEISTHPLLTQAVSTCLEKLETKGEVYYSIERDKNECAALLMNVAHLFSQGYSIDMDAINKTDPAYYKLPVYPWQHTRFWFNEANTFELSVSGTEREAQQPLAKTPDEILSEIKISLAAFMKTRPEEISDTLSFIEMGSDSIMVAKIVAGIQKKYNVKINMRQLFEELSNLRSLANYLSEHAIINMDVENQEITFSKKPVEKIKRQQAGPVYPFIKRPEKTSQLTDKQQQYVTKFIQDYNHKTNKSKQQASEDRAFLADSRANAGFRPSIKSMLYPIVGRNSIGSQIQDIDDNKYIDISMDFGVNILGHQQSEVSTAITQQLKSGIALAPRPALMGETAKLLCKITDHERAVFCTTGSEAVMTALRLARVANDRPKVVIFEGAYHGHSNEVLATQVATNGDSEPVSSGITSCATEDTITLNYNTAEALRIIAQRADEISAVLVEPVQARHPYQQPRAFLKALRKITNDNNITLIFDEMITGFRLALGGAQQWFKVKADVCIYGKILGGGLPVAAIAGQSDIIDGIDGGSWQFDDDSYPTHETTFFAGTFNGFCLSMASANALLKALDKQGNSIQENLNQRAGYLVSTLNDYFFIEDIPIEIVSCASLFRFYSAVNIDLFFYKLIYHGIFIWEGRNCFLSTAHSDDDIENIIETVKMVAKELKQVGLVSLSNLKTLTLAQKQLWALSRIDSEASHAYQEQMLLKLHVDIDPEVMQAAWNEVISRHESLRMRIHPQSGEFLITKQVISKVEYADISNEQGNCKDDKYLRWQDRLLQRSIDLGVAPLAMLGLVRLSENEVHLLIVGHHVIADGWALGLISAELLHCYKILEGKQALTLTCSTQFSSYNTWLHDNLTNMTTQKEYWENELAFTREQVFNAVPGESQLESGLVCSSFTKEMLMDLTGFSRSHNVSTYVCLLACFQSFLHNHFHHEKLIVGCPTLGRAMPGAESLVAYCSHLLPVVSSMEASYTFTKFLENTRLNMLKAFDHQDYPYAYIMNDVGEKDYYKPLIEVVFNLDKINMDIYPHEMNAEIGLVNTCCAHFPLTFQVAEHTDHHELHILYQKHCVSDDSAASLLKQFIGWVDTCVSQPNVTLNKYSLITNPVLKKKLLEWNNTMADYPKDKTIYQLFEEQVNKSPNNTAVVFEDEKLTYKELNQKANQLARLIRTKYKQKNKKDLKPDSLIGLCVKRSLDMIIGILGILKAGAAYIPLDPNYPQDRLEYMIEDSHEGLIIVQKSVEAREGFLDKLHHDELLVIDSDHVKEVLKKQSKTNLNAISGPSDLAYVIYTSGSTGKPKGVMIEHSSVVNYVSWLHSYLNMDRQLVSDCSSNIAFDFTLSVSLASLIRGDTVCLCSDKNKKILSYYVKHLVENNIYYAKFTPGYLSLLLEYIKDSEVKLPLKKIIIGGEAINVTVVSAWLELHPECQFHNEYGPTESTVGASQYTYTVNNCMETVAGTLIGLPGNNIRYYVLDNNLNICPIGIPGELHIGGTGLARGYLNQKKLTTKRFIPNPFRKELGLLKTDRIYKTGDLVRWLPDGNIEYLGRTDFQVKIRGFRIELGEIESVLAKNKRISQVCAVSLDKDNQKYLAVYYVLAQGKGEPSIDELRAYLSETLPDYMVPSAFVKLDEMPLTPNGKVNRKALPDPDMTLMGEEYVAPRSETEKKLADIWGDILKVDQVGIHDNFFSMGGDSIISIQLVSRCREHDIYFTPKDLFQNPTIATLSLIDLKGSLVEAEQGLVKGNAPLIPIQQWFFEENYTYQNHWNQAQLLQVNESLDIKVLEIAIATLIHHHDGLRLRYKQKTNKSYQQYYDNQPSAMALKVKKINLSKINSDKQATHLTEHCSKLQGGLDITKGPVIAVAVFTGLSDGNDRLFIAIHHLMVDGVSWRVIVPDLQSSYRHLKEGKDVKLSAKTSSYQDWGNALIKYADQKAIGSLDYWLQVSNDIKLLKRGVGCCKQAVIANMDDLYISWSKKNTDCLLSTSHSAYNTEVNDLLLSAFSLALASWQEMDVVSFDLEGHGREECVAGVDVVRTVGWFTSLFPITLILPEFNDIKNLASVDFKVCIQAIKEQIRDIPNKGLCYGVLKYCHPDKKVRDKLLNTVMPEVSFNYLGQFGGDEEAKDAWVLAKESYGNAVDPLSHSMHLLDLNGMVIDGQLNFAITYSTEHFTKKSIKQFSVLFKQYLEEIISHCEAQKSTYYTPSDFPTAHLTQDFLNEELMGGQIDKLYALSPLQEGMLFHALYAKESDQYCVQIEWTYESKLNVKALKEAWQQLVDHYDTLRTRFIWDGVEEPVQMVVKAINLPWFEEDYTQLGEMGQIKKLEAYVKQDRYRVFDLNQPCLMRFHLIKLDENKYHFVWTYHHIVLDGWCNSILFSELVVRYNAIKRGEKPIVAQTPLPYETYIQWISTQERSEARQFWTKHLSGIEMATDIRVQKTRVILNPNKPINDLGVVRHKFDILTTHNIEDCAKTEAVTVNSLVQLALANILSRFSGENKVIYGSTMSGRSLDIDGIDEVIGLLITTLPMVVSFEATLSVAEHLKKIHKTVQEVNHYSYCGLSEVQRYSGIPSGNPLFSALFVFENYPAGEIKSEEDHNITNIQSNEKTNYPLSVIAYISEGQLQLKIDYDRDCFSDEVMATALNHMVNFIRNSIKDVSQDISKVRILEENERQQLLVDWNDTAATYPKDKTIYQLFEEQVKRTPNNTAVVFEDEKLTYKELNQQANQLARLIRTKYKQQNKKDLKPDSLIGLCVERSFDMIIGILGILKAGAAYVPLDPDYPQDRLEYMIKDSHEGLIITQQDIIARGGFLDKLHHDEFLVIDCYQVKEELKKQSNTNLKALSGPNDLAYVIYTSGSTGRPKGVMIEQQSLVNHMQWMLKEFNFDHTDVIFQKTSYSFDASIWELFLPLTIGAKGILSESEACKDPEHIVAVILSKKVTVVQFVPALFDLIILDYAKELTASSLTNIFCGGEALKSTDNINKLDMKKIKLSNLYGPTESTIDTCFYDFDNFSNCDLLTVPIGKPIRNIQLYVLDNNHNPCPIGTPGELYIGGAGLARGYLNQEKLTNERFIPNPFAKELGLPKADRIYKTGDLVRWLPDGNIEYLGRTDFQVKIRGFRIELGEIENVLAKHKAISQVSVIDKEKEDQKYLAAYYVLVKGKSDPGVDALRTYLSKSLPDYMVPTAFVQLDEMPLTLNGKINRKALPDPDMSLMGEEYVAPRNEVEQKLADIWCDVLKIDQVGIYDNFFHLGGHSLLATQLISRLHAKLNCRIPIKTLFDKPKLVDFAEFVTVALKEDKGEVYTPIKRVRRLKSGHVMSFAQGRLWFLDQFEGTNDLYNIPLVLRLAGKLNINALTTSINQLITRQDSFRTVFVKNKQGKGRQKVLETLHIDLKVEQLKSKALKQAIRDEVHAPFDLEKGPLIRVRLFEVKPADYILVFNHHHIISDGWSINIISRELSELYAAAVEKRAPQLASLSIQYVDFSTWQQAEFNKPIFAEKVAFWKDHLSGYETLNLPIDKPRPAHFSYKGANVHFSLNKGLSDKLAQLAIDHGTTLYIVLLMAVNILMSRYSDQADIVIGSPIANRYHHAIEDLVGFFVNTLALRNHIDGDQRIDDLLENISRNTLNAFEHQEVPFEQLVQMLDVTRDTSRNPIIQVMFSLQSFGTDTSGKTALTFPGIDIKPFVEGSDDIAKFDLSLFMQEAPNGLVGSFNYCTDLFHQDSIERMGRHFEQLLTSIVEDSSKQVKALKMLTDENRKQILIDWNDTVAPYPKDKTIYQLFEEQVKRTPNNTAVVFEDEQLTYSELNARANQLARLIRTKYQQQNKKDLKPDSLIGLCVERSFDMIIGILGILKAGAAYVPLDPDYPQDRLEYMIKDSHEGLIITQQDIIARGGFLDKLHHDEFLVIDCYQVKEELKKQSNTNLKALSGPNDLAYVIYTSGSTGRPKGVMIEQQSLVNHMQWMLKEFNFDHTDVIFQKTSYSFDASIWELFLPLTIGAKGILSESEACKDPEHIVAVILSKKVTVVQFVPALFDLIILDYAKELTASSLTNIFCGGEALKSTDNINKLDMKKIKLSNLYGPTESTIDTCFYDFDNFSNCDLLTVPIGKPIRNIQLYVLDNNHNPCPIGTPGELYIGGAGLARGYLNQKKLTTKRFIPNPFRKELGLLKTDRIYKTGDLVRWLPDGNIEYLGRTDFQVKIRGFRIELGEIESVLAKNKRISQVCAVSLDKDNQKYLAVYYVLAQGKGEPSIDELRAYLSETLPDYMVPSAFVKLDEMPLTPNGKVNRKALPDPDMTLMGEEYVAPRSETEKKLADIWGDILKVDQVGIHDNFFSMGGDSIISIQLVSRCREHDIYFTPKDLFQNPTIATLSLIDLKGSLVEAEQGLVKGNAPLIPIQQWFFEENYTYQNHWNQAQLLQVNESLDIKVLEIAIATLIHHHDGLRLRYKQKTNQSYQQYYDNQPSSMALKVKKINLSKINSDKQATHLTEHCSKLQGGLDITKGPVIAVAVFTGLSDGNDRLFIAIHHLMVDGVSWRVIVPDLQSFYNQMKSGVRINLSAKTSSFKKWGHAIQTYANQQAINDLNYWQAVMSDIKPLIFDFNIKQDYTTKTSQVTIGWDKRDSDALLNKTQQAYHTEINDLLLSAFSLALAHWQQTTSVSFNLEGHGREEVLEGVDVSRTVGWFTSLFPVAIKLPLLADRDLLSDEAIKACIQSIKEQLRKIPDKGLSFGALKYCHKDKQVRDKMSKGNTPQISFNYLGQFGGEEAAEDAWVFANESSGQAVDPRNHHPNLLDLNGAVVDGKLGFSVAYSCDHFSEQSIAELSGLFKQYLQAIIKHCEAQTVTRYTPSDFPTADLSQASLDTILHDSQVEQLYALSSLQEGMLFHALHASESDQYCVQLEWTYEGQLNPKALKEAWQGLINHHDILRTKFIWHDVAKPVQVVEEDVKLPWTQKDYSQLSQQEKVKKLAEYVKEDRLSGFDLTQPCLMRLHLIKLAKDRYHFIWTNHHILLDGWCNPILFSELSARYDAFIKGIKPVIVQSPPYRRYIEWTHTQNKQEAKQFWIEQLSGVEKATDICVQKAGVILNPNKPIEDLGSVSHVFDLDATKNIEGCAQATEVTVNSLVQLSVANVLSRYSGESTVIYGSTLSGRSHDLYGIDKMIGLLITTLPMTIEFEANKTVAEHLKETHQTVQEVNHYSYCGLSEVHRYSGIPSGNPLFNVLFVFENYPSGDIESEADLNIINIQSHEKTNYPLSVIAYISEGQLQLKIDYDRDCFSDEVMATALNHMVNFIRNSIKDVSQEISKVRILEENERQQILVDWNDTAAPYPKDKTIYQLFEEQVIKTPNNTAVVFEDSELTYKELNQKANQLARLIRTKYQRINNQDFKPDSLIGLCVERSLDLIIGIMGILKAGAAYVPLDPDYPKDRLEYMIEDSHEGLIITQQAIVERDGFLDKLHHDELLIIDSDHVKAELSKQSKTNLKAASGPDDLAYVIYTSGSTGRPKGVMLPHHNVNRLFLATQDQYDFNVKDVWTMFHSYAFDFSVWELWGALLHGGKLVVVPHIVTRDPELFYDLVCKQKVTVLNQTPSAFQQIISVDNLQKTKVNTLRYVIFGGEALNIEILRPWWKKHSEDKPLLVNMYGITETTVHVTYEALSKKQHRINKLCSIGRHIKDLQAYILDNNLNPCPIGALGELHIGGAGLARGYLNQPKLTAERFIANPFLEELGLPETDRIYKTGDLVRWLPDGNIEYLGRTDFQVKIRGFRIELGEIENVLAKHKAISQVSVIDKEKEDQKYLAAYYVLVKGKSDPGVDVLRTYLSKSLPDYMVPTAFVQLDKMPLTLNGKINRKALPDPDMSMMGEEFVAPRNEVEILLVHIWQQNLDFEKIGIDDNFFLVGGNSLLSIQITEKIRSQIASDLRIADIFKYPTIRELAGYISSKSKIKKRLVKLNSVNHAEKNIFMTPGSSANPYSFLHLSKSLSPQTACYGTRNPILDGGTEFYSVERLAEYYITGLLSIQPRGPYYLLGHSFGAYVAYEMANRLFFEGHEVGEVFILDSVSPTNIKIEDGRDEVNLLLGIADYMGRYVGQHVNVCKETLRSLQGNSRYSYYLDVLSKAGLILPTKDYEIIHMMLNVHRSSDAAIKKYRPNKSSIPITLLIAEDNKLNMEHSKSNKTLGWEELTSKPVNTKIVSGDHITMITSKHVDDISDLIKVSADDCILV